MVCNFVMRMSHVMRLGFSIAAVLSVGLLALPAHAGDLSGTVHNAVADPVAGVLVTVPALGLETVSDEAGGYRFENLPEGEWKLGVKRGDDAVQQVTAQIPQDGDATRNVFLISRNAIADARAALAFDDAARSDALADQAWDEARKLLANVKATAPSQWVWRDDAG